MTEGTTPDGAPARVTSVDVIIDYSELASATMRLGQIGRLHQAEARRVSAAASRLTAHDVADAWHGANRALANALADLEAVTAMIRARQPAISDALEELEDIKDTQRA